MQQDQFDMTRQHLESKKQAMRYIKSQLVLTVIISTLCLFFGAVKAYSALAGGLIATVASAWFAYKVFTVSPESAAETMLASAYIGEIYKIILTGALFICAFVLIKPISAVVLLVTYFIVHMTPAMLSSLGQNAGDTVTKREK